MKILKSIEELPDYIFNKVDIVFTIKDKWDKCWLPSYEEFFRKIIWILVAYRVRKVRYFAAIMSFKLNESNNYLGTGSQETRLANSPATHS